MQKVIYKPNGNVFRLIEKNDERAVLLNSVGHAKSVKIATYKNNYIEVDKEGDNE